MASAIDITKPTAGSATTASVRTNFSAANTEISALQAATTNIDNTSDANKPTSTATQTKLDLKADITGETLIDSVFAASSVRQIADDALGTGTHTFDYSAGDMQQLTATGDITVEFDNMVASNVSAFLVDAINWGAHTIELPASIEYVGGAAPTLTTSGRDRLLFLSDKDAVLTLHVIGKDIQA